MSRKASTYDCDIFEGQRTKVPAYAAMELDGEQDHVESFTSFDRD